MTDGMYSAMRGMPEHVMVYREVQPDSFDRHVADLEGALLTDRGYLCTWLGAEPPFDPHFPILIHLVAAQGTPAIYLGAVDPDCHNMLLLGRGLTYRVDRVDRDAETGRWNVHAWVVPPTGEES